MDVELQIVNAFVDNNGGGDRDGRRPVGLLPVRPNEDPSAGDILIEQGHLMSPPSPSIIHVRLDLSDTGIVRLMAGGKARLAGTRLINL